MFDQPVPVSALIIIACAFVCCFVVLGITCMSLTHDKWVPLSELTRGNLT